MTTCDDLLNSFASALATKKPQNAFASTLVKLTAMTAMAQATPIVDVKRPRRAVRRTSADSGCKRVQLERGLYVVGVVISSLPQFLIPLIVRRLGPEVHLLLDILELPAGELGERLRLRLLPLEHALLVRPGLRAIHGALVRVLHDVTALEVVSIFGLLKDEVLGEVRGVVAHVQPRDVRVLSAVAVVAVAVADPPDAERLQLLRRQRLRRARIAERHVPGVFGDDGLYLK